jgi:benzoyl-CoA reductase/2-hydroxyglutaryl-CoA dehydratase subunit BcrC/BadD/HgdB
MVTVPHSIYDAGLEWYKEELCNFRESLMNNFGVRLTDEDLSNAIKIYNESRRLIYELYELRKSDAVPISGKDAIRIILSAYIMPRDKYNVLLEEALSEIKGREGVTDYKARLMVSGSALDDPRLVEIIESLGGIVVTDSLCFGSRYYLNMVEEEGDPLEAIAKRYYRHNPCPRMMGEYPARLQFVERMAREAKVDGIIMQKLTFCDAHGVDNPMLAEDLEESGIPVLTLERDYMLTDIGRLKTRIEAFMERIARG